MLPPDKETDTEAVMSQESTQVNKDGNLFNLGTMPASDDTEIHNQDTSTVGLNRAVIDLTGTPSQIHGNKQSDMGKPENPVKVTGNTYSTYKEKIVGDMVIEEKGKGLKITSDDFLPIKKGIKVDSITDFKSAGSKKSENTNSFALPDFDNVDDEDTKKEGTEDQDKSTDDEEILLDLLFSPTRKPTVGSKKNFLQILHNNIGRNPTKEENKERSCATDNAAKKKKKQEPIPEILKVPDKRLCDHAYAMEVIENKIKQKHQNNVSLQDLAWYILSTKPRFGHMKAQLAQDCTTIQHEAARDLTWPLRRQ